MKYIVNPNNRFNNLEDNTNLCFRICLREACPERCNPRCDTYCRIDGWYCKVGNGRNEINSTGSFI